MKREELFIFSCEMPTGYKGYYLADKQNKNRYSYKTMFKDDLKNCEIFEEGVSIK